MTYNFFTESKLLKAVCVLGLSSFNHLATAHSFGGALNGNAGASGVPTATEYYKLTCDQSVAAAGEITAPATRMLISIRDTSTGTSLVGVTLSKPDTLSGPNAPTNKKAQTTIDPVGGLSNTAYSPEISVAGGEGVYYATVFHTGTTADNFVATFHCVGLNNLGQEQHSGTREAERLSNQ
jgi:hypothetical protein